jgi:hypothetical protein
MTSRREAWLPALVLVLTGAALLAMPPDDPGLVGRLHAIFAVFLLAHAVAATVAAARGAVGARVAIAVSLLTGGAALSVAWLAGLRPPGLVTIHDWRQAAISLATAVVAAAGLVPRFAWARWMALAMAVCGMLTCGLNLAGFLLASGGWWAWGRALLISLSWAALLGATLAGPAVRDAFLARRGGEVWASPHRVVTSVRWAILANVVAIPMLLVYAWTQPVVPATVLTAQILAVLLLVGVVLSAARKVVGALVLVLGGFGMLAQTAATIWLAHRGASATDATITYYYAVFWTPAAVLSLVAGAALVRPVAALVRR